MCTGVCNGAKMDSKEIVNRLRQEGWSHMSREHFMYYPILIPKETDSCFGVTVPDLPGCFSAGDSLDNALKQAQEAIELHIEGLLEDNQTVPIPKSIDHHAKSSIPPGGTWALASVDLDKLLGPAALTASSQS
jgi:predicted RNase H-like HicB family nuclease